MPLELRTDMPTTNMTAYPPTTTGTKHTKGVIFSGGRVDFKKRPEEAGMDEVLGMGLGKDSWIEGAEEVYSP